MTDKGMIMVSVETKEIGTTRRVLRALQERYDDRLGWYGINPEGSCSLQFTLENITDHIIPAFRLAEDAGDLLGTSDAAFLHSLVEKFEKAAEEAALFCP